ncbi:MAG: phosphopentomutase [Paracoccaceae bacterium]|nr:phosphopentomutase [Paracoccaceae bacterium]
MARAFLIVMDSVGIGGAPDAGAFFNGDLPDTGANTLGHIAEACARGLAEEGRSGPLKMPNLDGLGLGAALELASGITVDGLGRQPRGLWGAATEISKGKDTPSGHWELAGVPVPWNWHYFPKQNPAFSADILDAVKKLAGCDGTLCNTHSAGLPAIDLYGAEHMRTGWPICYTSADSVFQIAAHEESFGLDRLLSLCENIAPQLHAMKVGRVIARPFIGTPGKFMRTPNRHDYAIAPPSPTLCDWVQAAGGAVHAIGKIGDIFSMRGIDTLKKGIDLDLFEHLMRSADEAAVGSLTFANFVEFDSVYGHPRDVSGYARALEWFDARVGAFLKKLLPGDLAIFTADHGNDPSWPGTDHTRERVPVVGYGLGPLAVGQVGFADVAASIAKHLNVPSEGPGRSFL